MLMVVCLCVTSASASRSVKLSFVWLWRVLCFCRCAFVILVMSLPSGACKNTSMAFVGWSVISNDPVGAGSRSGLIGLVVKVVCLRCQLLGRGGGMGVLLVVSCVCVPWFVYSC